jgi:DNA-binding transcriptional LysR family regulator
MDLHHLKVFASVFRNRSFSRASQELRLSQPTVSDHIRSLEEELGFRLFDRMGRTVLPTREAETLYPHAVDLVDRGAGLREIVGKARQEVAGEIVIGASTLPGTYLVPGLVASFRTRHPAVTFRIPIADTREIVENLLRHELLMGIVGARLKDGPVQYQSVAEDELIVVAPPALFQGEAVTLETILDQPLILREEGSGTRQEMERILEGKGFSVGALRLAGIFGSTEAVKQAVKAGLGVAILSRLAVRDDLKDGSLREVRIRGVEMKRKIFLVTHPKRSLPLAYRLFSDHLRQELKKGETR